MRPSEGASRLSARVAFAAAFALAAAAASAQDFANARIVTEPIGDGLYVLFGQGENVIDSVLDQGCAGVPEELFNQHSLRQADTAVQLKGVTGDGEGGLGAEDLGRDRVLRRRRDCRGVIDEGGAG